MTILDYFILTILIILPLMISVAFFTLAERKIMGLVQKRQGPTIVGFYGLLQPLADGLKLFLKEIFLPQQAYNFFFIVAPLITLFLSFLSWSVIPLNPNFIFSDINLTILMLLTLSSLSVYGIILAGWASNSKYAFLGTIRSIAQMLSYEISLGFSILPVIVCSGSLNLYDIILKQHETSYIYFLTPAAITFFISILAETNRAPFDLPEAEAEIVAGYNLEYSSITFAIFFLGEYSNMLLMSSIFVAIYLGGFWPLENTIHTNGHSMWFAIKLIPICFLFIFIRANFPRIRFDQLMDLCWKVFLPQNFSFFIFICGILVSFKGLPCNFIII